MIRLYSRALRFSVDGFEFNVCRATRTRRTRRSGSAASNTKQCGSSLVKSFPTEHTSVVFFSTRERTSSQNRPPCISTLSWMCPCKVSRGDHASMASRTAALPTLAPDAHVSPTVPKGGACVTHSGGTLFSAPRNR